eukprot:TRINITY_DN3178_c0_g1_i1.p1 TRINITY_DN3178_c0_g1~~TRINITY_DN3178_c0_g1_i1.p1  ORF type:complete len:309 (+),score=100.99 TRINITY_DN3178_c0_g1_i1:263-1189(+)
MSNPLHKFFHEIFIADFKDYKHKVVTVPADEGIEKAVSLMAEHKLTSLPVVDTKDKNKCLGMVDTLDVATYVLSVAPDATQLKENELKSLEIAGRAMALETVRSILNASGRDPYVPIIENEACTFVINLFARGLHRVPIIDRAEQVTGTLSQTNILQRLHEEFTFGNLKDVAAKTIKQLGLGMESPVRVRDENSVLFAIKAIAKEHVSAVPVIDEFGRLVGNFSASDLKGMYTEQWPSFRLRVDEYLAKHSPNSAKPVVVYHDTKLSDVVKELVESKVHRVWVVDGEMRPQGVVSTTDIMKLINASSL